MAATEDDAGDEVRRAMNRELARPRPERRAEQDRTRVVLVRQPVKDVSSSNEGDGFLRMTVGLFSIVVLVAAMLLALGALGSSLGFSDALGLPHQATGLVASFIEGTAMVASFPSIIRAAGNNAVLLPLFGLVFIGLPCALLVLARPRIPGARPPRQGVRMLSDLGALLGVLIGLVAVIWCVLPWRAAVVDGLPADMTAYGSWRDSLDFIAANDIFLFISLLLWCVLGFRFSLPRWGRAFTVVILLACTATIFVGMARSTGTIQGLDAPRPMVTDGSALLVGGSDSGMLIMILDDAYQSPAFVIEPGAMAFKGRSSIDAELRRMSGDQTPGPRP